MKIFVHANGGHRLMRKSHFLFNTSFFPSSHTSP
uniref:Uncharacterized protein n=1 Tax=Rhizophora mucronata TaxID=61149 RepID=A0A2P2IP19_RHIMU